MSYKLITILPPAQATERGKPLHLGKDEKNKKLLLTWNKTALFVRDVENPIECWEYSDHKSDIKCARLSPNGYNIATVDAEGSLKIWSATNEERPVSLERPCLPNVMDMQWDGESQRVVLCGSGGTVYADAFLANTGSNIGELTGATNPLLSIDIKKQRPYRVVAGGENNTVYFYEGPPFRFNKSFREHQRYVNCVRYSPDGSILITVGSDKKGFVFDAKTGDKIAELNPENGHKGSIYSLCFNDDGSKFITVSADKTAKIWDTATYTVEQTFEFENKVHNMQVGTLWQGDTIVTLSLRGDITYLNRDDPTDMSKVIYGHQSNIISLISDQESKKFYSLDFEGRMIEWELGNPFNKLYPPNDDATGLMKAVKQGNLLFTAYLDCKFKITDLSNGSGQLGETFVLEDQKAIDIAADDKNFYVLTSQALLVLDGQEIVGKIELSGEPTALGVNQDGSRVVIGYKNKTVRVFERKGLDQVEELFDRDLNEGSISVISFSPNGKYVAVADTQRHVLCFFKAKKKKDWTAADAAVTDLAWNPDNAHLAVTSVAANVNVVPFRGARVKINPAANGTVSAATWIDEKTLITAGVDRAIRVWEVEFE